MVDNDSLRIEESIRICNKVAKTLKKKFPDQIMAIKDNTIIPYSKKNKRLIKSHRKGMNGCLAFFTCTKPHRVVIKQKVLITQEGWCGANWHSPTPLMENGKRKRYPHPDPRYVMKGPEIYGNYALVDLMCHELAHHRTTGGSHHKSFKIKYHRFLKYMVNQMISGEFYR